jgi:hypothetical protein
LCADCEHVRSDAVVALEQLVYLIEPTVRSAYATSLPWPKRVHAALRAILVGLDENRGLARRCAADVRAGSPTRTVVTRLAQTLDKDGRSLDTCPPSITAEAIEVAAIEIVARRLIETAEAPLLTLLRDLTEFVIVPYAGRHAAASAFDPPPPRLPPLSNRTLAEVAAGLADRLGAR